MYSKQIIWRRSLYISSDVCYQYLPFACILSRPAMTIAVDLGRKAIKQTNKSFYINVLLTHVLYFRNKSMFKLL